MITVEVGIKRLHHRDDAGNVGRRRACAAEASRCLGRVGVCLARCVEIRRGGHDRNVGGRKNVDRVSKVRKTSNRFCIVVERANTDHMALNTGMIIIASVDGHAVIAGRGHKDDLVTLISGIVEHRESPILHAAPHIAGSGEAHRYDIGMRGRAVETALCSLKELSSRRIRIGSPTSEPTPAVPRLLFITPTATPVEPVPCQKHGTPGLHGLEFGLSATASPSWSSH